MKKVFVIIYGFLFNLLCSVFRCNYKHLDDAYQEELPASPEEVRETLMYKRLKRFIKIALLFKDYSLILDLYKYLPSSSGRCIWNIVRDETSYVLYNKDKFNCSITLNEGVKCKFVELVLGKWKKGKFVELASIETFVDIEEEIKSFEEDNEEDIEYFDGESIHRPNASIYDAMLDYYVGYVYPDGEDSFYRNSNIPSGYICIPVYCKDGMFFAFMTEEEIRGYTEGLEEEEE